jgi:hypothetical protein
MVGDIIADSRATSPGIRTPSLTLSAAPGRISVNLVAGGTIVQSGDALTLEVPVRITLGMQRGVATVTFSPGSLPQGVSVSSPPSYVLSANDYPSVPEWPPTDVDVTGSLMGRITLAVNLNALVRDNPTAEINWSAYNGQQTGSFLVDIAVQAKRVTPLAPVDLRPQNGASGIQNAPYLFFVDPGAGTTSAADSFEFLVSQNNVVVDPQPPEALEIDVCEDAE